MAIGNIIRVSVLACGALASCTTLASCGAGTTASRQAGTQTTNASAPSYAVAGNAICAQQVAALHRLPRPTTTEQAISYLPPVLAIMRREASKLRALAPAGTDGHALLAALASSRRLATLLSHLLYELRHGIVEFAQITAVQTRSTAMRAQIDARFRQADLPRCVE